MITGWGSALSESRTERTGWKPIPPCLPFQNQKNLVVFGGIGILPVPPERSSGVGRWVRRRLPALLRAYQVNEAYLFGSWGRGDADEASDIDVIVVAPSTRPFVDRFRDYPEVCAARPSGSTC